MNKTALKNFAVWARNKLIADITYKAGLMGITEDGIKAALPQSTEDTEFYDIGTKEPYLVGGEAVKQRGRLVELINGKAVSSDYKTAFHSVVEEVAYTWFNRLIAVRFMEVNDYLPSRIRVLSSESTDKLEPDLVTTPFDADLELTETEKAEIIRLKNENQVDALFRMLFIKQCNALNVLLPKLFEKTADYSELLLNISVTDQDGVVYRLVHDIPEDDFNIEKGGQVEIIGWLYQYYNTEPKDEAFALLKKNVKITKERIPAVTQLFTPDWIVRYMVENSLGRLWLEHLTAENKPGFSFNKVDFGNFSFDSSSAAKAERLKANWKYYLDEAQQEADVQAQLDKIREGYKTIRPEDIKVIDPCMGSGHILVYAFDVLMQIYESAGYTQRDAAKSILEHNLYGLDIDDRAFQLAYFAVMMKARQYNRRILNGEMVCHVYSIQESNTVRRTQLKYFGAGLNDLERNDAMNQIAGLLDTLTDAKEYGSILNVEPCNWDLLRRFASETGENAQMSMDSMGLEETKAQLQTLIDIGEVMAQKYDVVVTNPPYMGTSSGDGDLNKYIKKNYPDSKSDLFAVMIEKCGELTKQNGFQAMITQHAWMFLSSFEKLRAKLSRMDTVNMAHLGARAFEEIGGEVVQTTSFVLRKSHMPLYKGTYCRLVEPNTQKGKENMFLTGENRYESAQDNFSKIPGSPIAYWVSSDFIRAFESSKMSDFGNSCIGMRTGDNERFLRLWYEVSSFKMGLNYRNAKEAKESKRKWFPYCKGGSFRKWYGNNEYVVNWENDGFEIKENTRKVYPQLGDNLGWKISNETFYFQAGLTWSGVGARVFGVRSYSSGMIFDSGANSYFVNDNAKYYYFCGLLNCKIINVAINIVNPTINTGCGVIAQMPAIYKAQKQTQISATVKQCIENSANDWDSFETSWDFTRHPLVQLCHGVDAEDGHEIAYVEDAYNEWQFDCEQRFKKLKSNEEELNRIFIDIYGLQDELTPEVEDKDVTVARIYDTKEEIPESMKGNNYVLTKCDVIKSFISYAVGCMFGRYSLDVPGLAYAGGEWDDSKYSSFIPDKDNILPITDEAYFEDDIVGLFCAWLKKVYGTETLEENLAFVAQALGNKGHTSREVIRNYFLNNFFKDHCKTYKKRPIYWLFDSGKQNGFKALIYLHHYNENTVGNLRIDYLHRMERVYDSEIVRMQDVIDNSTAAREVTTATKRKEKLQKQIKECKDYDEKIAHLALARIAIDLDDGVKVNYEKVQTVDGKKYPVLAKI